jgi:hypothetical protein
MCPHRHFSEPYLRPARIHERRVPDNAKNRLIKARLSGAATQRPQPERGAAIPAHSTIQNPINHRSIGTLSSKFPLTTTSLQNRSPATVTGHGPPATVPRPRSSGHGRGHESDCDCECDCECESELIHSGASTGRTTQRRASSNAPSRASASRWLAHGDARRFSRQPPWPWPCPNRWRDRTAVAVAVAVTVHGTAPGAEPGVGRAGLATPTPARSAMFSG